MIRPANALSDALIKDGRTITVTGQLRGVIAFGNTVRLDIHVPGDTEIEVHAQEVAN